jgi:microcystin-dependent protein
MTPAPFQDDEREGTSEKMKMTSMEKAFVLVLLAACAAVARGDSATNAVPRSFVYQGVLSDPVSGPLAGPLTATFRIYADPTGGEPLWTGQKDVACTEEGLFHAWLEDDGLPDAFGGSQRYLEVEVAGHGKAIVPRLEFTAVPQVVLSRYARQATNEFAVPGDLSVVGKLAAGNVTVGGGGASFGGNLDVGKGLAWTNTVTNANAQVVVAGTVSAAGFTGDGFAPVGSIVMWGSTNIPAGWVVCNGENDTPDLRGLFLVGAGTHEDDSYEVGDTGGADEVALAWGEMPPHQHSYTTTTNRTFHYAGASWTDNPWWWQSANNTNNTPGSTWTEGAGGDENGNTQPHENRPPYYAVYYIMRVK